MAIPGTGHFTIERLGECRFPSPMQGVRFTGDGERLLYHSRYEEIRESVRRGANRPPWSWPAPEERLFFDPAAIACGIVTCGGLCPGINDVIRAVTLSLHHHYGVRKIYGFRYGYEGLVKRRGHPPFELTPASGEPDQRAGRDDPGLLPGTPGAGGDGGTTWRKLGVGILFAIGGERHPQGGRQDCRRGGPPRQAAQRHRHPKTIDNDISFVQKTFGFEDRRGRGPPGHLRGPHRGLRSLNAVCGLVKLMGRDSGFIAAFASLIDSQVNFCPGAGGPLHPRRLPPEAGGTAAAKRPCRWSWRPRGPARSCWRPRRSATPRATSSSVISAPGCATLSRGISACAVMECNLKYIDPSYIIRSQPANPHDSALCLLLGQNAVHAGMSGRSNMVVGLWNHQITHVPIALATRQRKKIDPEGWLWSSVLASTGQPREMR